MILTPAELAELTGKRRQDAQRRVLDRMGLRYMVRPDGTLAVLRAHVENVMGGVATIGKRQPELHL